MSRLKRVSRCMTGEFAAILALCSMRDSEVFRVDIHHVGNRRSMRRYANVMTVAFAGLVYLALWLCAKLGISIPFLSPRKLSSAAKEQDDAALFRTQAAAPPTYLIIFPLVPVGAAIYISSTRYSDFWHHGFDVFTSSILGTITAWLGFRWYHMPIRRGGGWAWAPRSSKRAYWKSMGFLTYVDNNDGRRRAKDLESGGIVGNQFPPPPGSGNVRNSNADRSGESYEMGDFTAAQEPRDFIAHGRGEQS